MRLDIDDSLHCGSANARSLLFVWGARLRIAIGTGRQDRHIRKQEDTHAGRDANDPGSIALSGAVATAGEKRSSQGNGPGVSVPVSMHRLGRILMRP